MAWLPDWLRPWLRSRLGGALIGYGLAEINQSQFPHSGLTGLIRTFGDSSPTLAIAVVANVVALNFSYDVPVKLLSTTPDRPGHCGPDLPRLARLFLLN